MRIATCFVVVCCALAAAAARPAAAQLSIHFRANPLTPQAIAADPALAGMQSWSLMMTNTAGFWSSTGVRMTLPVGHAFYHHPIGLNTRPSAAAVSANPAVAFDTYVSSPADSGGGANAPSVLGPYPENQPPFSFGGASDPAPGLFSVSWGDPQGRLRPPGTYELARFTWPSGMSPSIDPRSLVHLVNPSVTAVFPEPAAGLAVLALAATMLNRARPRRGRHASRMTVDVNRSRGGAHAK